MHLQRVAIVQIAVIAALPAEGLAALLGAQAESVNTVIAEQAAMLLRKVLADDADQARPGEEAGGVREVGRRTAERVVHGAAGRLDAVERQGADDQKRLLR